MAQFTSSAFRFCESWLLGDRSSVAVPFTELQPGLLSLVLSNWVSFHLPHMSSQGKLF